MFNHKPYKKIISGKSYRDNNVTNIGGIRKENLIYLFILSIYYIWIVFFANLSIKSPFIEDSFVKEFSTLLQIFILIFTGIFVFVVQKQWFVKAVGMGIALLIIGIILFLIAPNKEMKIFCVVIMGIGIGLINISILIPFVFNLNNTEKLYSILFSNVLINMISLLQMRTIKGYLGARGSLIVSGIFIAVLSSAIFFKKDSLINDFKTSSIDEPIFNSRIYLTLFFNCVFIILCKGIGNGILNNTASISEYPILTLYYLGGLIGCMVYFTIYALSKRPFIWLGNITFSFFAMGLFCNTFVVEIPVMSVAFSIMLGVGGMIGIINMYYIIGVVSKKYNSMSYLRLSILFLGICGGMSGFVVSGFMHSSNTFQISTIASIFSVAVMLIFIMLSPVISQSEYYNDWAKDSENIEIDNEQIYMFKKYNLSNREIEVCKLLLQGYTMRQISGFLSIAYSTVNTYCTSIYRKLEINSKIELIILFKEYTVK